MDPFQAVVNVLKVTMEGKYSELSGSSMDFLDRHPGVV